MPTIKQKRAVKEVLENHGSIGSAMRKAGYSKNTAKNPKLLTDSTGWQELMEQYLPDKLLGQKHKALLNKKEFVRKFDHALGEWVEEKTDEPETQAVSKGLDMAYKLKGKYAAEKKEVSVTVDPEQRAQIEKAIDELL